MYLGCLDCGYNALIKVMNSTYWLKRADSHFPISSGVDGHCTDYWSKVHVCSKVGYSSMPYCRFVKL